MSKVKVAVLYGGKSVEHEVSVHSAEKVCELLSDKFEVLNIFIDKTGHWFLQDACGPATSSDRPVYPTLSKDGVLFDHRNRKIDIDVFFPVLHGTKGEDGALQGFFEVAEIPFTGCGVIASAMGMNKEISKIIAQKYGVPILPYVLVARGFEITKEFEENVSTMLGLPVFVKPVNLGSSIGVTKVKEIKDLKAAVEYAAQFDTEILVEKGVDSPREIFCAIKESPAGVQASLCGELIPNGSEFFDYDSKYIDPNGCITKVPASIDKELEEEMRAASLAVFKGLKCAGLARVDFLLDAEGNYYFSEINTLPGMSDTSLFPQLWRASGSDYKTILEELVETALKHAQLKKILERISNENLV
ncbi:D-alanine-D-alanine ligase [Elusimicrobium posterum]|uniref:D-alanine--D-alanine ligase family protein n=1 Tax=Elusimicrobium posterum TaxID=3116653 RepID=UPI003C74B218